MLWFLSPEKGEGGIPFSPPPFCEGAGALAMVVLTEAIGIVMVRGGYCDIGDGLTKIGSAGSPGEVDREGDVASAGSSASGRIREFQDE